MKRLGAMISVLILAGMLLSGCAPLVETDDALDIYASFYPIYALMDGLTEGIPDMTIHCLVQPQDGCLREYTLSDWDLYLLASSADGIIIGGRGLESFESTLFSWGEQGPAVSAILYNLELYNQDEGDATDEESSHFDGANPHLYMSLEGAMTMLESLEATLISLDPQYVHIYADNLMQTQNEISALQDRVKAVAEAISGEKVIVMNEALVYVAEDYQLEIDQIYPRESGEGLYDQALSECLETLSKSEARAILIERQAPQNFKASLENAGYTVVALDVLSDRQASEGFEGYLQAQQQNKDAICEAFGIIGIE